MSNQPLSTDTADIDAAAVLVKQVGQSILAARTEQRMSRRALSEISGVSQRTIVLLESGAGNISLSLLYRLTSALDCELASLFDNPKTDDSARIARLFSQASVEQQSAVRKLLCNDCDATNKARRVCLIGLRGAGKSTLGRQLASSMSLPFVELNDEIESLSGITVTELIGLYGQEGYRRLERQAIDNIINAKSNIVVAVAGGVVSNSETWKQLSEHFHSIWLRAGPEEHMARVRAQGDERPMAGNPEALNDLKTILLSREQWYSQADLTLDTSNQSVHESAQHLINMTTQLLSRR